MDKFYVITNESKDEDYEITRSVRSYIEERGKTCVISHEGAMPEDTEGTLAI